MLLSVPASSTAGTGCAFPRTAGSFLPFLFRPHPRLPVPAGCGLRQGTSQRVLGRGRELRGAFPGGPLPALGPAAGAREPPPTARSVPGEGDLQVRRRRRGQRPPGSALPPGRGWCLANLWWMKEETVWIACPAHADDPPRAGPLFPAPLCAPRLPLCIVVRVNATAACASLHRLCSRPGVSASIGRGPRSGILGPDAERLASRPCCVVVVETPRGHV